MIIKKIHLYCSIIILFILQLVYINKPVITIYFIKGDSRSVQVVVDAMSDLGFGPTADDKIPIQKMNDETTSNVGVSSVRTGAALLSDNEIRNPNLVIKAPDQPARSSSGIAGGRKGRNISNMTSDNNKSNNDNNITLNNIIVPPPLSMNGNKNSNNPKQLASKYKLASQGNTFL